MCAGSMKEMLAVVDFQVSKERALLKKISIKKLSAVGYKGFVRDIVSACYLIASLCLMVKCLFFKA